MRTFPPTRRTLRTLPASFSVAVSSAADASRAATRLPWPAASIAFTIGIGPPLTLIFAASATTVNFPGAAEKTARPPAARRQRPVGWAPQPPPRGPPCGGSAAATRSPAGACRAPSSCPGGPPVRRAGFGAGLRPGRQQPGRQIHQGLDLVGRQGREV